MTIKTLAFFKEVDVILLQDVITDEPCEGDTAKAGEKHQLRRTPADLQIMIEGKIALCGAVEGVHFELVDE